MELFNIINTILDGLKNCEFEFFTFNITLYQVFIFTCLISIVISFIRRLFND